MLPLRLLCLLVFWPALGLAQGTSAFTYQGRLDQNGQPKIGTVDLRFDAYAAGSGGLPLNAQPVILDGVPLNQGVFAVQVDFGNATFTGAAIFLEVGVREDAAGGAADASGFTALLPRQQATATPYSLHAARVAQNAIGGGEIANDSITGADVLDGSLNAGDVDTTSAATGLQRRLANACTSPSVMTGANADGSPTCASVVRSISTPTGSGLNSSVTAGVAALSVDPAESQFRVRGRCQTKRAAITQINDDGSVACGYHDDVTLMSPVTVDSGGDVGSHLSVRRVRSGTSVPAVAYYDATNKRLKYAKCSLTCTPLPTPVVIDDPSNDVGQFVSIVFVNSDPYMAYYDATAHDLKLAICDSDTCTGTRTIRTIDSGGDVGRVASIMNIGSRAAIVYYDATNNGYKYALCNDALCTAPSLTTLNGIVGGGVAASATAADRGGFSSKATFLVLAGGTSVLMVACADAACSSFTSESVFDTPIAPPLAMNSEIVNGALRHWVAAANPSSNIGKVVHCPDPLCASPLSVGGSIAVDGVPIGLALTGRPEGVPIYFETTASPLTVGRRAFSSPVEQNDDSVLGAQPGGGAVDASALSDGIGVFFYNTTDADLMYVRCERNDCSSF